MPDCKELYLHMMRASEAAIRTLIAAQQDCEEAILSCDEPVLTLLPNGPDEPNG